MFIVPFGRTLSKKPAKDKKYGHSCDKTDIRGKTEQFRNSEFGKDVVKKQYDRGMLDYKCHGDDD